MQYAEIGRLGRVWSLFWYKNSEHSKHIYTMMQIVKHTYSTEWWRIVMLMLAFQYVQIFVSRGICMYVFVCVHSVWYNIFLSLLCIKTYNPYYLHDLKYFYRYRIQSIIIQDVSCVHRWCFRCNCDVVFIKVIIILFTINYHVYIQFLIYF